MTRRFRAEAVERVAGGAHCTGAKDVRLVGGNGGGGERPALERGADAPFRPERAARTPVTAVMAREIGPVQFPRLNDTCRTCTAMARRRRAACTANTFPARAKKLQKRKFKQNRSKATLGILTP